MSQRSFVGLVNGIENSLLALQSSAGAADANKIVATGSNGRLDSSLLPAGVGAQTIIATASETVGAGKFVNFHNASGTFSVRLADNSNGRQADGYVLVEATIGNSATVYPLDGVNSSLSALTVGSVYFLGTAGAVTTTPLNPVTEAGTGKISQRIGIARSATELITSDSTAYIL